MPTASPKDNLHDRKYAQTRSQTWRQRATRIDPSSKQNLRDGSAWQKRATYHGSRPPEIIPGTACTFGPGKRAGYLLPEEPQSDELLQAITSGEVNCLSGSCEPCEQSSEFLK